MSLNPSDSPKEIWNFFSPYTIKMKRRSYLQFLQAFLNTILSKGIKCASSPAKEAARYSLCGAAVDTTAMPWGAIPEVPGGGCPERGIGCPMVPRPPIPPRDCPGPREGMPIPAAPAAGPPVRLCSAFIGSVGTQGHRVSAECQLNHKVRRRLGGLREHTLPSTYRHDSLKAPSGERLESREPLGPQLPITPQEPKCQCVCLCSWIVSPPRQGTHLKP